MTMSKANSSCQNRGGDLVLPRNNTEHDAIWKVAKENKLIQPWIGLHEKQQTNIFYTLDGKLPSYTNWGSNQPNLGTAHGDEKCVVFYESNGKWHDVTCNNRHSCICQKTSRGLDWFRFYKHPRVKTLAASLYQCNLSERWDLFEWYMQVSGKLLAFCCVRCQNRKIVLNFEFQSLNSFKVQRRYYNYVHSKLPNYLTIQYYYSELRSNTAPPSMGIPTAQTNDNYNDITIIYSSNVAPGLRRKLHSQQSDFQHKISSYIEFLKEVKLFDCLWSKLSTRAWKIGVDVLIEASSLAVRGLRCHSGFTGSRCDVDIDECKESPGICQNRANCTNTNGSYTCTCTCTAAYTGRNCSINIDDCKTDDGSSKCLNNGTCIDGEDKFSCKCQDPYFDTNTNPRVCYHGSCIQNTQIGHKCPFIKIVNSELNFFCTVQRNNSQKNVCINSSNCSCRNANWRSSFNRTGWSKCPATFPYINGLYRSSVSQQNRDYIYHLEQAKCCEIIIGTCVHQDLTCPDFTVQAVIICTTLSVRGAVNLVEPLIPTSLVTMRTFGRNLTGIDKGWCHVPDLVIISLACIDPPATICIVLKNSNVANCRLKKRVFKSGRGYNIFLCTNVTCLNGGICMNGTCSCHSGFTGSRCDVDIDECKESPGICQNRANCTNTNGSYTCTCTAAYTGRNCSINIDDCKTDDGSSKCLNNGTCIDGEAKFSCKCQDPYFGPLCAHNECTSLPCHNDGQCVVEDKGYRCKCKAGFTGVNCETPPDHCLSRPCQNNATCTTIGNTTFKCNCAAGFTGYNCGVNVDDCLLANCQNNALCRDGINEYKCVCVPGFHGPLCQYQDVNECLSLPCLNNGNCINRNGRYICECPLDFTGKNCEKSESKDLFLLSQKEVNISNVVNVTKEVKKLSVSRHPLQAGDIGNIATILQKIVAVKQKANKTFDDFCTTINNVLDASKESVFRSQQDTNSSSRIVKALNDFLETLVIDSSGKFEKFERNYDALVQAVQPQTFSGLTFSGIVRKSHKSLLWNGRSVPQAPSSSISIPGTIFNESTITNSSRQQRIIFVLYKETSFFKVSLEDTKKTSSRLNSFVIAGSIKGLSVRNLSNPVKIALVQSVARGDTNSTLCSYWNFTLGNWLQEGCLFRRVLSDGRILCNCNHLTNFAMLMVSLFIYLRL
ncbi:fibropellin-1 isoform X4 [Paramuricea clavata]|uniref:Fibropellin-1 isoform X4 n=1 Tax=Paramuricea clavata TaxID=317549 RepID=A0A6S7I797_PARCT|nr:fibropellin-1 isoform X4 [Paramuricea clavata]